MLSGEQTRWTKNVADLKKQVENLAGDSLMAAASICYNGPFIYSYRVSLENDWRKKIKDLGIIHTEGITMKALLENPIEVNEWKRKEFEIKDQTNPDGSKAYDVRKALSVIDFNKSDKLLETLKTFCTDRLDELKISPMRQNIQEMVELFNSRQVNKKFIENAAKSMVGLYEYLVLLAEYVDNCEKTIDPIKKQLDEASAAKNKANAEKDDAISKSRDAQANDEK